MNWLSVPKDWVASFGEIVKFCSRVVGEVLGLRVLRFTGEALRQAGVLIVSCYKGMTASGGAEGVGRAVNQAVVISFLGIFAFNYVFTQTLLATHPEISIIK